MGLHLRLNALLLFLFTLGLKGKPMLAALPFILLLVDYWPLKRFSLRRDEAPAKTASASWAPGRKILAEKVSLVVLAFGVSVVTLSHALAVTSENVEAHKNLGKALFSKATMRGGFTFPGSPSHQTGICRRAQ